MAYYLLTETGDYLLQETGDKIELEQPYVVTERYYPEECIKVYITQRRMLLMYFIIAGVLIIIIMILALACYIYGKDK